MKQHKVIMLLFVFVIAGLACSTNLGQSGTSPTTVAKLDFPTPIVPTLTPTATLVPTPVRAARPTVSSEQYTIEILNTNETVFTDNLLGYRVTFPPEWLVIPIEDSSKEIYLTYVQNELSDEMDDILERVGPHFERTELSRMLAIDYTLEHMRVKGELVSISMSYRHDDWSVSNNIRTILEYNAEVYPTLMPGTTIPYQVITTNPNGIEYAQMVVTLPNEGRKFPVIQLTTMTKL